MVSENALIPGFDVSKWQGSNVDFTKAAASGQKFVFIKATEGVGYVDPQFERNWRIAGAAGLIRGAYHFARVSRSESVEEDARAEATWFARTVGTLIPGDLPPVLDIEWDKRASGIKAKDVVAWCHVFLETLEELTGRVPIVYTGVNFWRHKLLKSREFDRYPLWLVQYTSKPRPHKPLVHEDADGNVAWEWKATFWQWSHTGPVAGVGDKVDENFFFGTMKELRSLAGYTEEPSSDGVPEVSAADSVTKPIIVGHDPLPAVKTTEGWFDRLVAFFKQMFPNRRADLVSAKEPPPGGLDAAGGNA